ncbi:MAG: nucleoside deaminase [Acaryochloridaceae cyanobacterium CSU_3_4]|nr:nucleoside deaminase [Acaryochloridaceae cyanobacterium CSU_3_4]
MAKAISLAAQAGAAGEVPVGAVIIGPDGDCLAEGENRRERERDPTAHAEILALKAASQVIQSWRLQNCTLYVTLEPCPMCAGAIIQARISLLVYGASDPKTGAVRTVLNLPDSPCSFHKLAVISGIQEARCRQQLQTWFAHRRGQHKQQKSDPAPQREDYFFPSNTD